MAVVIANYVKRGKGERGLAKANIRYIQERPGRDKERLTRVLFGQAGIIGRYDAYQFIDDEAKKGSFFYRFKLSPDPSREDARRDLDMHELTRTMMRSLEKRLQTPLPWAGALHDDHTNIRHLHLLAAIPRRLHKYELEVLIRVATQVCHEQRRGLDVGQEPKAHLNLTPFRRLTTHQTVKSYTSYPRDRQPWYMPRYTPRGGKPVRLHTSCSCPRCHFPQSHNGQTGIHECVSCGQMLHKKRELSLQRKGRGWERSR